jgi:hypothetical protein
VKSAKEERDSRLSIRELGSIVGTAASIARELSANVGLQRLLRVFLQLPRADRAPLLGILEREVAARRASVEAGDGIVGSPNPIGTIYMRIFENDAAHPRVTRDDMVRSTVEAVALMSAFPEVLFRETEAAVIVGIDALTDAEADALARVHEDVLQVLESMP